MEAQWFDRTEDETREAVTSEEKHPAGKEPLPLPKPTCSVCRMTIQVQSPDAAHKTNTTASTAGAESQCSTSSRTQAWSTLTETDYSQTHTPCQLVYTASNVVDGSLCCDRSLREAVWMCRELQLKHFDHESLDMFHCMWKYSVISWYIYSLLFPNLNGTCPVSLQCTANFQSTSRSSPQQREPSSQMRNPLTLSLSNQSCIQTGKLWMAFYTGYGDHFLITHAETVTLHNNLHCSWHPLTVMFYWSSVWF